MESYTLVLGASLNESRYANKAIKMLVNKGFKVKAIGKKEGVVDTVAIVTNKPEFKAIDTVTLYLNPFAQEEYYEYLLKLQPRRVIFNPGTENIEFIQLLEAKGIQVEIACTLVLLSTNQY